MESHISFKWKNLDLISSQVKFGPFKILSKKTNQKIKIETEKQNNYSVVNQFQVNLPFLHPLIIQAGK